jgi:hypothetical protein
MREKWIERIYTHLLLRCEVVDDVEKFAYLFGALAFDHVCNCLATDIAGYLENEF